MKRVLVLGGSFSAVEMIKCARSLGYYVLVCGRDPEEPGHFLADESVLLDYSDSKEIINYLEVNPVDYVIPTANDAAYRTGIELSEIFQFPGLDKPTEARNFLEKNHFRNLCGRLELNIPVFEVCDAKSLTLSQLNFNVPFLIKPINGFSGKGIFKVENGKDREKIDEHFSIDDSEKLYVLENFLDGTLHSHSAFIRDGKIESDFFVDEFCVINQFAVDSSNHPSVISNTFRIQIRTMIEKILQNSNLEDGLIHTQFLVSNDEVFLIESMRRCPGDLYPSLINLSTGFDYIYNYIAPFLQLPFRDLPSFMQHELPIARFTIATRHTSLIFGIKMNSASKGLSFYPLARNGDHLKSFPDDKAGVLFVELQDSDELFLEVPQFQKKIGIIE